MKNSESLPSYDQVQSEDNRKGSLAGQWKERLNKNRQALVGQVVSDMIKAVEELLTRSAPKDILFGYYNYHDMHKPWSNRKPNKRVFDKRDYAFLFQIVSDKDFCRDIVRVFEQRTGSTLTFKLVPKEPVYPIKNGITDKTRVLAQVEHADFVLRLGD